MDIFVGPEPGVKYPRKQRRTFTPRGVDTCITDPSLYDSACYEGEEGYLQL